MIKRIENIPAFKNTNVINNYNLRRSNTSFDEFIKNPQTKGVVATTKSTKKNLKPLIIGLGIAGAIALATIGIIKNKNKINELLEINKLKKLSNELAKKFPEDDKYRKRIAQSIGLSEKESYKLASIAGVEELNFVMSKNATSPDVFSPGSAIFDKSGKFLGFNKQNLATQLFGINLHTHTVHSDGNITVANLLDDASNYANKRMVSRNQPFYIGITDHDGIEGCKEAIQIVKNNPKKFQNLRLFLGLESTVTYKNPQYFNNEGQIHILSYGINPHAQDLDRFITPRIIKNHENINRALNNANEMFGRKSGQTNIDFDLDDFAKLTQSIKTGLRNSNFYMKDYLQFKLIYNETITHNKALTEFLKTSGINLSASDYAKPMALIGENLDYSKGQKYYEYYYKALQKHILELAKEKNPNIKEAQIAKLFPSLSKKTIESLDKIEQAAYNESSKLYIPPIELVSFEQGIETLANMKDGVLSFAHPGVIFPANTVKDTKKLPELFEKLYELFKIKGKDKAQYVEGYYQSYFNTPDLPIYKQLIEIGKRLGLKQTGGLDTMDRQYPRTEYKIKDKK